MRKIPRLKAKIFEQSSGLCGIAAARTTLDWYSIAVTEKKLARIAGATKVRGINPPALKRALRHYGLKVFSKQYTKGEFAARKYKNESWRAIKYWVAKREIPVLVLWFSGNRRAESHLGHYSNILGAGTDERGIKWIWIGDPEFHPLSLRIRLVKWDDFFSAWFDYEGPVPIPTTRWYYQSWMVAYLGPNEAQDK